MRENRWKIRQELPWIILVAASEDFFTFVLWLTAPDAFGSVAVMAAIFAVLVIASGCIIGKKRQERQMDALQACREELEEAARNCQAQEMQVYQEYIEAWTHEVKTPLSLATLVLDNHREEMSPYVYDRMAHVHHAISGNVDRILYYARLQADHVDYKFERLDLETCVRESLDDFLPIAKERGIDVKTDIASIEVISDRKVLAFMLAQILSNALKYADQESGRVSVDGWMDAKEEGKAHLKVRDNGNGVPYEDLPFIFDKGFTGHRADFRNSTGMGLYFVKKYAEKLAIQVKIDEVPTSDSGFGIELIL